MLKGEVKKTPAVHFQVSKVEGLKSARAYIEATIKFDIDLSDPRATVESIEQFKRLLAEVSSQADVNSALIGLSAELEKARVAMAQGDSSYSSLGRLPEVQ